MTLASAAAFLANEWPVFPTAGKVPLVKWRERASRDPVAIRAMFTPDATGIGVPMGEDAGVFLVDLDGADGQEWIAANRRRLPATREHRTPSGGLHLLFRWPHGRTIKNSVRKIAAGVDIRGTGGFAVFPPTPGYVIEADDMPANAPGWLLDLIDPPAAPAPREPFQARQVARDRYAEAALTAECNALAAMAPDSGRNNALNIAAVKLGGLVAAGALSESAVRAELRRAAIHAGLDPRETDATIESGLRYGLQHPREIPEWAPAVNPPKIDKVAKTENPTALTDGGQPRRLPLVYWHAIQPSLGSDDFVEGLLIRGGMSVIYGPSNCGKTFWTSDLALHVATGRKWNGREVEPGGVIYCALEGSYGIANRVAAWRKHNALEGVEVPFAIIPVAVNLLDPAADTSRVIDAIAEAKGEFGLPVSWVIMDTLSRAMAGGNENSPEDMGALVTNGTRIQQVTGSHLSWIHHSGKDQAQGARGHSLLRAATDTEIEISRPDKDSPSTAKVTKQRELEIDGVWTFGLRAIELGTNKRGKPVTSCIVEPAEPDNDSPDNECLHLSGDVRRAFEILCNLIVERGATGYGAPDGVRSVPADWWRDHFYAEAKPGAAQSAKQKAFRRAADALVGRQVAMHNGRVWVP